MEILKENRNLLIVEGILFMILGVLAISAPVLFTFGVEFLFGCLLLAGGAIQAVRSYKLLHQPGFWVSTIVAILSLLLGFYFLFNPLKGILTLTAILMLYFFISGIFKIVFALEYKPIQGWGWLFFSGVLTIMMGAIIYSGWPGTALWVIGLLIGIDMLFFGVSLLSFAYAIEKR